MPLIDTSIFSFLRIYFWLYRIGDGNAIDIGLGFLSCGEQGSKEGGGDGLEG
jgi:hypothetical protein